MSGEIAVPASEEWRPGWMRAPRRSSSRRLAGLCQILARSPSRISRAAEVHASSASGRSVFAVAFLFSIGERESDNRVPDPAAVGVLEREVVSIGHVSTKGVGDELAPVRDIRDRRSGGATYVGNPALGRIEGKQDPASLRIRSV